MKIKIYWIDDNDETINKLDKSELAIFKFELTQQESSFARLYLTIQDTLNEKKLKKRILIKNINKVLFIGNLEGISRSEKESTIKVCYVAKPKNYQKSMDELLEKTRKKIKLILFF